MKSRRGNSVLAAALFVSIFCAGAPFAYAADLVNINTADLTTLETLNGIGPSKGQAIIDYRTQNGPFGAIADIQNVSGIGPTTYANIKDYITVGDAPAQTPAQSQTQTQSTTTTDSSSPAQTPGAALLPPISAQITGDTHAAAGAGTVYQGAAFGTEGEPLVAGVRYMWNFGDGELAEGRRVLHTYHYPGTYVLTLSVAYSYMTATAYEHVSVTNPQLSLVAEGDGSLTIYNNASSDLDIGLWSLADGKDTFTIPEGTVVLAGQGLRFAAGVTHLPGSPSAQLVYPNGTLAAAAKVAPDSPLRGEKVAAATDATAGNVATGGGLTSDGEEVSGYSAAAESPYPEAASVAESASTSLWVFAGLAAVLCIGAAGAWYASQLYRPLPAAATSAPEEEFDIE